MKPRSHKTYTSQDALQKLGQSQKCATNAIDFVCRRKEAAAIGHTPKLHRDRACDADDAGGVRAEALAALFVCNQH